ncbi:MAG: DUF3107 domain-containing protein [Acidimicrobiales bacterium]
MDVRIGVTQTPKEIELEMADDVTGDKVAALVEKALKAEGTMLWLTDRKGRRVGVPAAKLAYIEIGSGYEDRRVGFGAP